MSAPKSGPDSSDFTAIAALAVAVFALCITGAQVAQQYAASGEKIRLCDSSVYGPMPGRGRRIWNWVQLRFNVAYDMPQISINPDLWRFVHDTNAQNHVAEDELKNLPNLLLSQTSLEDSAEVFLRRPKWMWPFLVVRYWGLRSLLTWRIPVKPHPEADYQFSTISLATVIATRGDPDKLSNKAAESHRPRDSHQPDQPTHEKAMSVEDKATLLMETPRWLWPLKIARLWGWQTLFAWRIRRKPSAEGQPTPHRFLPRLEFVANVNTEVTLMTKTTFKHRLLRGFRQLLKLQPHTQLALSPEPTPEEEVQKMRREYADLYKDHRPSEASWVYFGRSMQNSCGSVLKYQMVTGDADRCPPDLPVVPMLVSLRDVVVLCLMSGMGFTRMDLRNRLVSMEGPAGVLLSSTHPILGSILRFIPRQTGLRLEQQRDRNDVRLTTHPAWLRRVVGRQDDALATSLKSIYNKLVSQENPPDLSLASRRSMMQKEDSSLAQDMEQLANSFGRDDRRISTSRSHASTVQPWKSAVSKQAAIRSWRDAWPRRLDGCFDHKDCNSRNLERRRFMQERLVNARADQSPHWAWASRLDTVRGFWATPWASQFDAGFCIKAQIVVIEALRLILGPRSLHFAYPQGQPEHQPPDFLYPAVTTIPYGKKHRSLDSVMLKELPELRATKEIQWVDGFKDPIPPLMLVDILISGDVNPSIHTSSSLESMRNQIDTDELMWIDSWLIEVAQCSDIQGSWLKDLDFRVQEAIELFHEDFIHQLPVETNAGTSHRRKLGRAAMEYAQGSAGDLLAHLRLDLDLEHARQVYFLAAMLRTFKTAYCIATGVDTKDAKEIFEKEISVYFA